MHYYFGGLLLHDQLLSVGIEQKTVWDKNPSCLFFFTSGDAGSKETPSKWSTFSFAVSRNC